MTFTDSTDEGKGPVKPEVELPDGTREDSLSERPDSIVKKSTESDLRKARPIMKIMSRVNVWLFRLSRGRIGARFPGSGAPVGLLEYRGRKSGRRRTMPLVFGLDGERVILIASQGGMPRHPIWYHSLIVNPEVTFQTSSGMNTYTVRELHGEEREEAWKFPLSVHPDFDLYQKRTDRLIPVILLEPRVE